MKTIRDLLSENGSRNIDRTIEKVIQFDSTGETQLLSEISEYIATDHIHEKFEKLLNDMDTGMEQGSSEIGVWISGFYGSGKSSFAKYFGMAMDDQNTLQGRPFYESLKDRFTTESVKTRLSTVVRKHKPAVILLDLGSQQLSNNTTAEISAVLETRVLQWAGYSKEAKVAYMEWKLEEDGKTELFHSKIEPLLRGAKWEIEKHKPMVAIPLTSRVVSEIYPELYPDAQAFSKMRFEIRELEDDRIQRILDLIRRRTNRQNILFVLDEVGQYIASREELILNLDGLARTLKSKGKGKVWILATAQQTLTEDDPTAQHNSAKLFKLKDRFPVRVELEANDIREICYRRLLGKGSQGQELLQGKFAQIGQALVAHTRLQGFKTATTSSNFIQFYPFLPHHLDVLVALLSRISKTTGGVGLRSVIRVVQDILVDASRGLPSHQSPLANSELGALCTAAQFYDTLRNDISTSFRYVYEGVEATNKIFNDSMELQVAKCVAIMQVIGDALPATKENIAALLLPHIQSPSILPQVEQAIQNLISQSSISFHSGEKGYRFMTMAIADLERRRREIQPGRADHRRILNQAVISTFHPLPSASIQSMTVRAGIRSDLDGSDASTNLSGDGEPIHLELRFIDEAKYSEKKQAYIQQSIHPSKDKQILLTCRLNESWEEMVCEIFRCHSIYDSNRSPTGRSQEELEYLNGHKKRAQTLENELSRSIANAMEGGSFLFRGQEQAVGTLATGLNAATNRMLEQAAHIVYDKHSLASLAADSKLAEQLLKAPLDRITVAQDPLRLVSNGRVNINHPALRAMLDWLKTRGAYTEGRILLEFFNGPPYGWNKDTVRYIAAAALISGEVEFRIGGETFKVRSSEKVQEALRSIPNFNKISVGLRDQKVDPATILQAAERLQEITGETVLPLEDEISKVVIQRFPQLQREFASLTEILNHLGLPGRDRCESIQDGIEAMLQGGASDAAIRLGCDPCPLYENLQWARKVSTFLEQPYYGRKLVEELQALIQGLSDLPDSSFWSGLKDGTQSTVMQVQDLLKRVDFHDSIAELQNLANLLKSNMEAEWKKTSMQLKELLHEKVKAIQSSRDWKKIGTDLQAGFAAQLDAMEYSTGSSIEAIRKAVKQKTEFTDLLEDIQGEIRNAAKPVQPMDQPIQQELVLEYPHEIDSIEELNRLIERLVAAKESLESGKIQRIRLG